MKKLLAVLVLLAVLLAAGAWWLGRPRAASLSEDLFTYAPAERGDLIDAVSGTGVLQPREVALVVSELPGVVVGVDARVNDTVTEGDVLLRLDDRKARLKQQEAQAGVETARANLQQARALERAADVAVRYQRDLENKGGFRSEREQAEVKLEAAKAGVAQARARLRAAEAAHAEADLAFNLTQVTVPAVAGSPSAGQPPRKRKFLVLDRKVEPGQLVGTQAPAPLFTLAGDLSAMEVHTEIAEGDVDRVRKGLTAVFTISSSSEPDRPFRGAVKQIRPMPASVKGAVYYNAVLEVANERNPETGEWWLRPGMTAAVDIVRLERKGVWKVPATALNFQMEEAYQTEAAKARLAEWQRRSDREDWRPVWTWDEGRGGPWPVFVRLTDGRTGRTGIKAGDFHEVLEWEQGWPPAGGLRLITSAPPATTPGLFERPAGLKVS